jgi:hypothetical protein
VSTEAIAGAESMFDPTLIVVAVINGISHIISAWITNRKTPGTAPKRRKK